MASEAAANSGIYHWKKRSTNIYLNKYVCVLLYFLFHKLQSECSCRHHLFLVAPALAWAT